MSHKQRLENQNTKIYLVKDVNIEKFNTRRLAIDLPSQFLSESLVHLIKFFCLYKFPDKFWNFIFQSCSCLFTSYAVIFEVANAIPILYRLFCGAKTWGLPFGVFGICHL